MLKRLFLKELGVDISALPLPHPSNLGKKLHAYKFEHECGTATVKKAGGLGEVCFLRVTDVANVLRTYMQLLESGLPVRHAFVNAVHWMASGDKGGQSTKFLLQCLDTADMHSVCLLFMTVAMESDGSS